MLSHNQVLSDKKIALPQDPCVKFYIWDLNLLLDMSFCNYGNFLSKIC